ncbi:MAG: AAA family ATPase [Acholeplasmataceae bacterium]
MNEAYRFFERTIEKGRLSHLYMLTGPKGSGKMKLALDVAYMIMSRQLGKSDRLRARIHERKAANLMVIEPEGLQIKKEQIRALQEEFSKTVLVAGPRIYCIRHIDRLTKSAANRLLKFMEEPQNESVYGFLLTENVDDVLRTIVSRSQVVKLRSPSEKELEGYLIEQGVEERLAAIAPYVTRDLDEAIELSTDPNFILLVDFISGMSEVWDDGDTSLILYFSEKGGFLVQDRGFFKTFLEVLLIYLLDLVHDRMNQPIAFAFLREDIHRHSERLSLPAINRIIDRIQGLLKRQAYNINLLLALDHTASILETKE